MSVISKIIPLDIYSYCILPLLPNKDFCNMTLACKEAVLPQDRLRRLASIGVIDLKGLQDLINQKKDIPFHHEITLTFSGLVPLNYKDLLSYLFIPSQNSDTHFTGARFLYSGTPYLSSSFDETKPLFQHLKRLDLARLKDLTNDLFLKITGECTNLTQLKVRNCNNLKGEVSFKQLPKLESLSLFDCKKIRIITLDQVTNLKTLQLWKIKIKKFSFLRNTPGLETLLLGSVKRLKTNHINFITNCCAQLKELRLDDCNGDQVSFENLTKLESLTLTGCGNITLHAQNTSLQTLHLYIPTNLNDFSFLENALSLKSFKLSGKTNLTNAHLDQIHKYYLTNHKLELRHCIRKLESSN